MLVILDACLFDDPSVKATRLLELLLLCMRRQHHAAVTDPLLSADSPVEVVGWVERQSPELTVELTRYLTEVGPDLAASHRVDGRRIRVEVRERSSWLRDVPRLTLPDAFRLLERPLKLLVEDKESDFAFLRAVAPPQWRAALDQALEQGSIDPEHGGGIKRMKSRVEDAVTHPDPVDRARLWVMCDSDRRAPDEPDPASESLVEACRACAEPWPIPCCQLRRRTIENYLPIPWLRRWPEIARIGRETRDRRTGAVEVIERRLDSVQRAHYNFKEGLLGDIRANKKDKRKAHREGETVIGDDDLHRLFWSLDADDRRALHDGLGRDVASMFGLSPDGRSSHRLDDSALHDELPRDEVEALMSSIFDWI